MLNSKVFKLYNALTQKETQLLFKLVNTDYFHLSNEEQLGLHLLNTIKQTNVAPSKQEMFSSLFGDIRFSDQKIRLLFSNINKTLENYISLLEFQKLNWANKASFQLKYLRENNLTSLFESKWKSINTKKEKVKDSKYNYQTLIDLQLEQYQQASSQKRNQDLDLQRLLNLSDFQYYYQKLLFSCLALAHESVYAIEYQYKHMELILADIAKREDEFDGIVRILYHCYLMLKHPEEEKHHQSFKKHFFKSESQVKSTDRQSLYIFAINYCIKKLNSGKTSYGVDGLDFYVSGIKSGVLFTNGKLSRYTYRNMAMMAIRTGDFDRAERMTNDYEQNLRAIERKPAFHMNMALINYYKKDLDAAMQNIIEVDFKDHLINLAAKVLQAKIYYEAKQDQALDSLLDSIEMYLIRKKVIGYHKSNYKNIIKFFKKLVKVNHFDKAKLNILENQIKSETVLTERKWFLNQLSEIKQ